MVENGGKWLTIQICHILNASEAKKNPGTEPKTCEKGPKLGFQYLPTSKTLHYVRTACMAFPYYQTTMMPKVPQSMGFYYSQAPK